MSLNPLPKSKNGPAHVKGAQPSKTTGQGRHGMDLRGDDFYPTPRPLTAAMLRVERLPQHIWEPAAGQGHMAAVLAGGGHTVFASDLIDYGHVVPGSPPISAGIDFFEAPYQGIVEAIVTNPPFTLSADFVRHGLEYCDRVYILNRLAFLEGRARRDIIDRHLTRVHVFENRPPMMHRWSKGTDGIWREWEGKKSDSAMAMAWFVFGRKKTGPTTLSRIRWDKADL